MSETEGERLLERKRYEDYAYVLDFLPHGKTASGRGFISEPVAQLLGEEFFTLLESAIKPNTPIDFHERIFIGKDSREKVSHIIGRVGFDDLTPAAKSELSVLVEDVVKRNEKRFVEFYNRAQSVTPRMHTFELLPGIGKKFMWHIINSRERKPFESFADIQNRTKIPDAAKPIIKRILDELTGDQKYWVFTRKG